MVSSRLIAALLDTGPVALLAVLAAWVFGDLLGIPDTGLAQGFIALLLVGLGALVLGLWFDAQAARRTGLALVAASYLGAHVSVLALDPAAALLFVTLLLVAIELRILDRRFAPILLGELSPDDRERLDAALAHSFLRVLGAAAIAYLGSYLTADLALSGALPLRSTATALLLSLALIAVVLLLAFWPRIERGWSRAGAADSPIQTAK